MSIIRALLTDGRELKAKYGLQVEKIALTSRDRPDSHLPSAFEKVFQSTSRLWNTAFQRKSYITGSVRWAVGDREKFNYLIERLKDLIEDLNKLTDDFGVRQSQRWIIKYELESIVDEDSLERITEIKPPDDDDDLVSFAASKQLSRIRERSETNREDPVLPGDSVSVFNRRVLPAIDELEEDVEVGLQPVEVKRVPADEWRKVKTRQGIFSWLPILLAYTKATTPASDISITKSDPSESRESWRFLRRENTLDGVDQSLVSQPDPSRLAVNSRILLATLERITTDNIPETNNVLIYPFKYLLVYEDRIRRALADAESVCSNGTALTSGNATKQAETSEILEDSSNATFSLPKDPFSNVSRIRDELACLVHFMDTDLGPLFKLKHEIQDDHVFRQKPLPPTIIFQNLWLLYSPGNIVQRRRGRALDGDDCAYFVLHVTGGRPILDMDDESILDDALISRPVESDIHDDESSDPSSSCTPLVVDTLFLDSNGAESSLLTKQNGEQIRIQTISSFLMSLAPISISLKLSRLTPTMSKTLSNLLLFSIYHRIHKKLR